MITKFKNFDLSEGRGKKYLIKRYRKKNLILLMIKAITLTPLSVKNAINKLNSIKKKILKNI